ncbi:hypothetical protein NTG1052_560030 [Candidatus Nitrotoga sp. 1052]|uniref:hypothetical protein n=1 Tax=Candidatus Nitrotoga sp. 1052 TaxID=2886964 RepID=UPI001EF45D70|nr:hypothetical protein [Candidatus Nitrotoga sp. 1052]CAH1086141.1 hypothetical protein NTG1052_560030 [Candidatus Nitrotoga sp. 1052]
MDLSHPGRPDIGQPTHYSLALAYAQFDPVAALQVLHQELSAPFPLRISAYVRRLLQVEHEALPLFTSQLGGAPARMVLAQSLYTVLIERMHPALNCARIIPKPPRDLVTTATFGDQQYAVQPVQKMRLAGRLNRGMDHLPDPLRAAEAEFAQGVNFPRCLTAESPCGVGFVASGFAAIGHKHCLRNHVERKI